MHRRNLLLGTVGLVGAGPLLPGLLSAQGATKRDPGRKLVLLQLSGGNDGLSMVVPHGDDAYQRARSSTRVETNELHRLDDYRGFHPGLARLSRLYQDGSLALVEGVGYPHPNRSHFKSMDIWHAGDLRGRLAGDGWIGRVCDAAFEREYLAERVVHIGSRTPFSLHSTTHPAISFRLPEGYRWVENEEELIEVAGEARAPRKGRPNPSLEYLRGVMNEAHESSRSVRAAAASYRTRVRYPREALAESLRTAAALLDSPLGTRIVSVELGGFDTHNDQRGRHDGLMRTLDAALGAFLEDLQRSQAGRDTLVLVFSEFGRRVQENGSRGTDHGVAGPMFVAGARVKGGVYGEHPSLTELDQGDLIHTTDFRSVYATAIEATLGVDRAIFGDGIDGLGFA